MRVIKRNNAIILFCISLCLFIVCIDIIIHLSITSSHIIVPDKNRANTLLALTNLLRTRWAMYIESHPGWDVSVISVYYVSRVRGTYFATTGLINNENTHFRGASITKPFTAASIMLLNQRHLLNIDDTIDRYLPNTPIYAIPYKESITIRQLLEHRAGVFDLENQPLRDGTFYIEDILSRDKLHQFTLEELIGVLAIGNYSNSPPSMGFSYSNTGYSILGKIIEYVSGLRYDQFVNNNFLLPNNLKETTFPWRGDDQILPSPSLIGHLWINGSFITVDEFNLSGRVAEGNLVTTLANIGEWFLRLFGNKTLLSSVSVLEMIKTKSIGSDTAQYGLGIIFFPTIGYGHTGIIDGFQTFAFYDPDDHSVLILSATATNPFDASSFGIFLEQIYRDTKSLILMQQ